MMKLFHFFLFISTFVIQPTIYGQKYYISTNGDDSYNGKTPQTAIKTLSHLNKLDLKPGDTVCFRRGDEWFGTIFLQSGNKHKKIHYTSYGKGSKPVINGSIRSTSEQDWIQVEKNLWRYNKVLTKEVGNLISPQNIGKKKWDKKDCNQDMDFYYDKNKHLLFVCAPKNPICLWKILDLALNQTIIYGNSVGHIEISNLSIQNGAAHGIQLENCFNIDINNTEISWIGGGSCPGLKNVRYGNGIELWGNNTNIFIERNYIHDIYDTGITNQSHSAIAKQENIIYKYNKIEDCAMYSFEIWNNGHNGSSMKNITFAENICSNSGCGWGRQRPDKVGFHINFGKTNAMVENITIYKNVFFKGTGLILAYSSQESAPNWFREITLSNNKYFAAKENIHSACFLFCDSIGPTNIFDIYQSKLCQDFSGIIFKNNIINTNHLDLSTEKPQQEIQKAQ